MGPSPPEQPDKTRPVRDRLVCLCLALLFAGGGIACPVIAGQGNLLKSYEVEKGAYDQCLAAEKQMEARSFEQAAAQLQAAAASDPTSYSSNIHYQLASCYYELKNYQKAIDQAELCRKFGDDGRRSTGRHKEPAP